MDVVGHEAIGPARDALPPALARQQIAIEFVVVVAEEHRLAAIAALRHMMGKARYGKTGDAGHRSAPDREATEKKQKEKGLKGYPKGATVDRK